LVIPTVSLALPAASQTAAVTIDNLGDLSLISQPGKLRLVVSNSNTGVETLLAGVTGFFPARGGVIVIEEDGNVVTYDLKGNSITLLDRATPTPLQFNASREMFGAVIVDNGTQAIVVYDLHTTQSYILARAPHPYVLGWVGYRVLVSVDNPQGLELELRGLDGSRELLGVGVLPTPLATPVWDNERRFLAYAAAGNTVVVVDVIKATSQVIRYACDPAWTPLGLQVTYESVGRVIRFK
ncbi:MAG: hypothetical protein Q8S19_00970, partial [Bacillota bacterium]|nr:hypothetical protein [Bacillota bacterium]